MDRSFIEKPGVSAAKLKLIKGKGRNTKPVPDTTVLQEILQRGSRSIVPGNVEQTSAQYKSYRLHSAFQPVISLNHRRIVGYEALVRGRDDQENPVPPLTLYGECDPQESVLLDRLCRSIHVQNYPWLQLPETWLFLNVSTRIAVDGIKFGAFFTQLLSHFNIPPHRIVIEVLEGAIQDEALLERAVAAYRDMGCLVALDDFGAGHSNFDRIWRLKPQIVKLDRSMIVRAEQDERVRSSLGSLVSLIHESGSIVLIEGIETAEQALIALETDADLVQGYFFGRPETVCDGRSAIDLETVCGRFDLSASRHNHQQQQWLIPYIAALHQAATLFSMAVPGTDPLDHLLNMDQVRHCYTLDENGQQDGANRKARRWAAQADSRFQPLQKADGANWSRRPYFRRAIQHPGEVQITRPYLSIVDVSDCVTLSIAVNRGGRFCVLCCDLALEERGHR